MSRARERLFKMLTAFSFDEIDQEFVDWKLFERLDSLVKKLIDSNHGVRRKTERKFLTTVRYDSFSGAEFLNALQRVTAITEIAEALNLGNMLLHYGYIYAIDCHGNHVSVKDDGTLYMFQDQRYWPSEKPDGSEEEYAIYLAKKKSSAKGKNGLNQNELMYSAKLLELFGPRWGKVMEKAEEQCKALKEKKKIDRIALEREEGSFWRVHRPMDNDVDVFDVGQKRFCNRYSKKELQTLSLLQSKFSQAYSNTQWPESLKHFKFNQKVNLLKESTSLSRIPSSVAINNLISHCDQYAKVDVLFDASNEAASSSRWCKDFEPRTNSLTLLRLERWSISLRDLLADKKGIEHFANSLKKEFSEENLSFWLSCEELKYSPKSKIKSGAIRIYRDFMAPGARFEINVDNKAMSKIRDCIKDPSMYAFDLAQDQIFKLMNTDSYPRFLKSQDYKDLIDKAKSDKTSSARKSNNRILNAARGLVNRSTFGDLFSNNNKQHAKLCRTSSDFQPNSKNKEMISRSSSNTNWFLQPTLPVERCSSENDLSALGDSSHPGSQASPRAMHNRMKLKGLPILKLTRSITPGGSPGVSPCHSGPSSRIASPLASPAASPGISRRKFEFRRASDKGSKQFLPNELNERLTQVKNERENEVTDDINDWHWQKVSHDFF